MSNSTCYVSVSICFYICKRSSIVTEVQLVKCRSCILCCSYMYLLASLLWTVYFLVIIAFGLDRILTRFIQILQPVVLLSGWRRDYLVCVLIRKEFIHGFAWMWLLFRQVYRFLWLTKLLSEMSKRIHYPRCACLPLKIGSRE